MLTAVGSNSEDEVSRLSGDSTGWTPLMFAALEGREKAIRSLALGGSDVNAACMLLPRTAVANKMVGAPLVATIVTVNTNGDP